MMVKSKHTIKLESWIKLATLILVAFGSSTLIASTTKSDTTINQKSTEYYTDYSNSLVLKPYTLYKLNILEIKKNNKALKLSPNSPLGIGVGLNYKFYGIALGFGLPHTSENIKKYGKTSRLDLQLSAFAKSFGIDGHLQLYRGYYHKNPEDFMAWDRDYYPQLSFMSTISIGTSIYYVFNKKKYSNKASVIRTQVQKKNAGSLLTGLFFSYDEADSPGGFIPSEMPDSISNEFNLKAFRYIATGVNLGYAYNWVISPSFYLSFSAISGGGYKYIRVSDNAGENDAEKHIHAQLLLRGAFGYENKSFFAGISGSTLIRSIIYQSYEIDLATEQLRFYLGYRFNVNQMKKRSSSI